MDVIPAQLVGQGRAEPEVGHRWCTAATSHPATSVAVDADEDWFFDLFRTFPKYNEDRNYTLGGAVVVTSTRFNGLSRCFALQRAIDGFFGLGLLHQDNVNDGGSETYGMRLFLSAFTPAGARLNIPSPILDDRPYSSIEGVATAHTTVTGDGFSAGDKVLSTEVDVDPLPRQTQPRRPSLRPKRLGSPNFQRRRAHRTIRGLVAPFGSFIPMV
jgi:hypothetical protein